MISFERLTEAYHYWAEKNEIENDKIEYEVSEYKPRAYSSYDAWKLASKDDDYEEKNLEEDVSDHLEEVEEYVLENIGLDLNEFSDDIPFNDSLYTDNIFQAFTLAYNDWKENKAEELKEPDFEY